MITDEQKQARQNSIGGSDAGTIAGVNPYQTARELFHVKRGDIEPVDLSENEAVHWGNVLEDEIAAEYSRRTGYSVRKINQTLRHPHLEFLTGHIDRDVLNTKRDLEVKNVGIYSKGWGSGIDEIPDTYICQVQHYMMLRPKTEVFDLAVLIGGQNLRIYEIPRDDEFIQNLMVLECEFWEQVQENRPPDFDYHNPTTHQLFERLYPGTNGETIYLPKSAMEWQKLYDEAKVYVKNYTAVMDGARAHLKQLCGESSIAVLPDGTGFKRSRKKRKGYTVEESSYMDFRFTKQPLGKQS